MFWPTVFVARRDLRGGEEWSGEERREASRGVVTSWSLRCGGESARKRAVALSDGDSAPIRP